MKKFVIRIIVNIVAIYVVALIFSGVDFQHNWLVIITAGLILASVNLLLKPILIILALPAIVFSFGFFSIVINGLMVWLTHIIYPDFEIKSFWVAILVGLVVGLLNYILTRIWDTNYETKRRQNA